jgi:FKBP-type peptidyl-prolyl cis-trans isomerase
MNVLIPLLSRVPRASKRALLFAAVVVLAAGCGSSPTAPSTLMTTDVVVGTGAVATAGHSVTVSYSGWLYDSSKANNEGTLFDSSPSFPFTLGTGSVIAGWDQGIPGMKVGGIRLLTIPPSLGYGSAAYGPIPANSTLVFQVTLLNVV